MAFSGVLGEAGHDPKRVATEARVHLDKSDEGFTITKIELKTEAEVPGIDEDEFQKLASDAKAGCPVSRALGGVEIEVDATLAS
jgi:osmotically inducible protein OsmC